MYDFFINIQKGFKSNCFKFVVIGALIILGLTACGETKDTETLISEATAFQEKGDNNAAVIQLKNALQQDPNNAKARFLLGKAYLENNDLLTAEKELNRALDLGMDSQTILPVLGQVLFDLGKFQQLLDTIEQNTEIDSEEIQILHGKTLLALQKKEESKAIFNQILAKDPNDPEALIGLAQVALFDKDIDLATQYGEQAIEKNPDSLIAWTFKANFLRAQGKPEEALAAFEKIVQLVPDNANAYYNKVALEIDLQRFDDAQNSVAMMQEIVPNSIMFHYSQALLDFNLKKHTEALEAIQTVLSAAPEHLPSVLLAGAIQLELGSASQAEQYLEQYLKNIPGNLNARKLMIGALLRNNNIQKAIEYLEPTLPAAPEDPQLLALAGDVYMRNGDFTKAAELYERANELVPNNAALHTALGMTKLAMGDQAEGIAALELATDLDKSSPRAGILLVLTHLRAKEFDKVLSTVDELQQENPQDPVFQNLKGVAYLGLQDFSKARESFNRAVAIQSDFLPAIANLARLDLHDKKPEDAKNRLLAVLKNDDKNIETMNTLAELAFSQGNIDEALQWLLRSHNKNPDALEPALRLAKFHLNQGENEKALLLARKLYGTHPNEPRVLLQLGQIQLAQNNPTAALDSYEKLAAQLPDSAEIQFTIANLHSHMEDYPATAAALKKALFINPDYVDAKTAQGRLALLEKKEDEAMTIAKKIQKEHADSPAGYELEGDILMKQQQPKMALQAYEKAFSNLQSRQMVIKIHNALDQSGQKKKARDQLTQWVTSHPNDITARLYLANNYLSKEQTKNAIEEYEAILRINPNDISSLNNLAWLYSQQKEPRALEYAERAYKISPKQPAIQDTLGWILVQQGETDRALQLLENAAFEQPKDSTIQYHYAYTLAKTSNQEKARQVLAQILTPDANFPEIEDARALLQQIQ